jgi:hypothetical protein
MRAFLFVRGKTMSNNLKQPIPDKVLVSGPALAQIINALNGPQYMILELLATRRLGSLYPNEHPNPINVIEDELLAYQRGERPKEYQTLQIAVDARELATTVEAEVRKHMPQECPYARDSDFENCALRNYRRLPE